MKFLPVLFLNIFLLLNSCRKDSYCVFALKNESEKSITYSYSLRDDTIKVPPIEYGYPTKPGDSVIVWTSIKYPPSAADTKQIINLYVFDWNNFNVYLKKYVLTLDSIAKKMHGTVIYKE